jgi:hypothetical protein
MQLRQLFSGEPCTGRAGIYRPPPFPPKTPECLAWSGDLHSTVALCGRGRAQRVTVCSIDRYSAILEAFYILNDFDIPKGEIRDVQRDEYGNVLADYTVWTSAIDPEQGDTTSGPMMIVRVVVDLAELNLSAVTTTHFSISGKEIIQHLNP